MNSPRFNIALEAVPNGIPATVRLRQALKRLLRDYGLRCVRIEPANAGEQASGQASEIGACAETLQSKGNGDTTHRSTEPAANSERRKI